MRLTCVAARRQSHIVLFLVREYSLRRELSLKSIDRKKRETEPKPEVASAVDVRLVKTKTKKTEPDEPVFLSRYDD